MESNTTSESKRGFPEHASERRTQSGTLRERLPFIFDPNPDSWKKAEDALLAELPDFNELKSRLP
jgi:hypothetical protein